ncbi:MAG TPA: hypothetical protein VF463_15345 [Sphingobium sp.]
MKYAGVIAYPDQTDEVIREAIRKSMSGTPGPSYVEFPHNVTLEEIDDTPVLAPSQYRLTNQGADADMVAEAIKLIQSVRNPILLVGHAVHTTQTGKVVKEQADLIKCPVIQTSGGTSFIEGLEDRTFPYGFSKVSVDAVVESDLCIALGTELGEARWQMGHRQPYHAL